MGFNDYRYLNLSIICVRVVTIHSVCVWTKFIRIKCSRVVAGISQTSVILCDLLKVQYFSFHFQLEWLYGHSNNYCNTSIMPESLKIEP